MPENPLRSGGRSEAVNLSGRVVMITGAGSGIGKAMAREFSRGGATVLALDIDGVAADAVADSIRSAGIRAVGMQIDIADPSSVESVIEETVERFGVVDCLCNNAGVIDGYLPAVETSVEIWRRTLAVNLTGPFLVSRQVIPHMIEQGGGVIINTASTSSFMAGGGGAAYVASKHGLLGLTRQLSLDYGRQGIRVNAICPGIVATAMTREIVAAGDESEYAEVISRTPAGRIGTPEEVAKLAGYLASGDAAFIHGSAFTVDGGWSVLPPG